MCEVTPPDFHIYIMYVYIKYYIQGRQSFVPFPRVAPDAGKARAWGWAWKVVREWSD